mgnify:CR=1 FL=1
MKENDTWKLSDGSEKLIKEQVSKDLYAAIKKSKKKAGKNEN